MASIWSENIQLPHFPSLEEDIKTDVLIIGGGITGILCAHFLQEKGVDYVLVEGRTICTGVTQNTTAKITSQHGLIYQKLLENYGIEKASLYLKANQDALNKYRDLCKDISCDFETRTAYVYSLDNRRKLEKEADALAKIGFDAPVVNTTELPFSVDGAIAFKNQAQFHPLKFIAAIARNLKIYEHTFVKEIKEHAAITDRAAITFQKVIFATHFPMDNRHGMYFLKLYQHRSYVIALDHATEWDGMYVDEAMNGMSFRSYHGSLLIGGGDHRTGRMGGNWKELREFAETYYPCAREIGCWATQDCMSLDGIPYIGQYSANTSDRFVATGFNKWGITSSMAAALILTDLIMEKENPYTEIFSPSRNMMKPQLFYNGCEALKNLITITPRRCPHMGCALQWNSLEHSWDCPCHGSRFDERGKLLNNPANGNLKKNT